MAVVAGDPVLRAAVAVEELGGGEDRCPQDGPRPGHHNVSILLHFTE